MSIRWYWTFFFSMQPYSRAPQVLGLSLPHVRWRAALCSLLHCCVYPPSNGAEPKITRERQLMPCVSSHAASSGTLSSLLFSPPFFFFHVFFFLEAWQEHSGEVSQPCQLSGLVAVPSHRWLGMADQWIQPHSVFSLFIFPSLKWPNPSGGFSSCSHYKNSLYCISIPDTDFSITFPLQLLHSLYPETVHRGHNWSSENWVLITYSMIKYHLALNIWGSFLSGQFIWFFDLQRFFIAIHGQMDVPCSWCKVYGFVLPFNNNHVRHSRGKCKGIFLAFRGENGRRNWTCCIELAAF